MAYLSLLHWCTHFARTNRIKWIGSDAKNQRHRTCCKEQSAQNQLSDEFHFIRNVYYNTDFSDWLATIFQAPSSCPSTLGRPVRRAGRPPSPAWRLRSRLPIPIYQYQYRPNISADRYIGLILAGSNEHEHQI